MALWLAVVAGLSIGVGGIIPLMGGVILSRHSLSTVLLALAGGAVLTIVAVDVIPMAWQGGSPISLVGWLLIGVVTMALLHRLLDSGHPRAGHHHPGRNSETRWLHAATMVWLGVALHNVMDGFGIGAGFEASHHLGWAMAAAVGLHNIPVGMLVATPLVMGRLAGRRVFLTTILAGLFTPLGAVAGGFLAAVSTAGMAAAVALAGGSLLYIILGELFPLSWQQSRLVTVVAGVTGVVLVLLAHGLVEG